MKLEIEPSELLSALWPNSIPAADYPKAAALLLRMCPPAATRAAAPRPDPASAAPRPPVPGPRPVPLAPQRKKFKPDTKIGKLLAAIQARPMRKDELLKAAGVAQKTFPAYIQMLRNSGYDVVVSRTPAGQYTYSLPAAGAARAGGAA